MHLSASAEGGPPPEEFARFVTDAFHAAWHVFGGFAYDLYAVKVRAADDLHGFSLSPVGLSITATDYRGPGVWEFVAFSRFLARQVESYSAPFTALRCLARGRREDRA